jgi:hypothetical protein
MIFETLGIVFGLAARLIQHWLDLTDKQRERRHESIMYDKQIKLSELSIQAEKDLRRMDAELAPSDADMGNLLNVLKLESDNAGKIGGWVAKLSSTVRPFISYWLMAIYTITKIFLFVAALKSGANFAELADSLYNEFDGALLGSVVGFWFADRSLRKRK